MAILRWLAGQRGQEVADLHFEFGVALGFWICIIVLVAIGVVAHFFYRSRLKDLPTKPRNLIAGLRVSVILLVCFLMLRPELVGIRYDPGRHYLALLFDDSRSMRIPEPNGTSRGENMLTAYDTAAGDFEEKLKKRYQLVKYRFGKGVDRIQNEGGLGFDQRESQHLEGLTSVARDLQNADLAGIVLFSDGVQQPNGSQAFSLPGDLMGIPVMTVATGSEESLNDLAIQSIVVPAQQTDRETVAVNVSYQAEGFANHQVAVEIFQDERIVAARSRNISSDDERLEVRLEWKPPREDWTEYTASVRLTADEETQSKPAVEWLSENNAKRFLLDHRPPKHRVLYFCGRPNWENKFIQRALNEDERIDLHSVLRISAAETKFVYRGKKSSLVNPLFEGFYKDEEDQPRYDESVFLRFGGEAASAGKGFPEDAEQLFSYDLVILGDIEAGFFAQTQLELIRDFVRKRGGTLLLLGGPHSFSEGDYQGTVLESLMPVMLAPKASDADVNRFGNKFKVMPTADGIFSGAWSLATNPDENERLWRDLPELTGLNQFPLSRAAANTLARTSSDDPNLDGAPLFAVQRYGEGKAAILATGASWIWHMKTDRSDPRHGRFWRQLALRLVQDVPKPIVLRNKQASYVEGSQIPLEMLARDKLFDERSGLSSKLTVTAPDGSQQNLGVEESITETGVYHGNVLETEPGLYRLSATTADEKGEFLGMLDEALMVATDQREFDNPQTDTAFLKRLSQETGGAFFTLDRLAEIPDRIPWNQGRQTDVVRIPIWHFPAFFLLLVVLMSLEWYHRRKRGHA